MANFTKLFNMVRKVSVVAVTAAFLAAGCSQKPQRVDSPADFVSTLVGTQSDFGLSSGNLYPATTLPWGMNCWTPMTGKLGDGWAYTYDSHKITGFKQTHQPSPWINDYGYYAVMPLRDYKDASEERRGSWFSHKSETAKPYHYQVYLADHDINAEIAPSERGAILRFTYPESATSALVIDAADKNARITVSPRERTITGFTTNNHGGVPDNFRNSFILVLDREFDSWEVNGSRAVIRFATHKGEQVCVRTASSFISAEQAAQNLKEVENLSFDEVKERAMDIWNATLGRIELRSCDFDRIRTFYSCLYRSCLFPRKFYEVSSEGEILHYSPYNGEVCKGRLYTDSGFWDVFRAQMPLLNLIFPSVSREIQEGLVNITAENAFLPEWASPGHRNCMVGNNSASVAADPFLKDIATDGAEELYDALVYASENVHPDIESTGRLGYDFYNTLGYIPCDVGIRESVARTLEYAYADWCLALMAEKLGKPSEEVEKWKKRSRNWVNVFDPSSRLMRGKNADGSFHSPFSPYKWGDCFTEGNAWHYTWSVFHDIPGLMEAMGGRESMEMMLDSVFVVPPVYDDSYYGYRIHEITEMQVADMGNYAHGNQPAQHMIYLYDYLGQWDKCKSRVREVMDRLYSCTPDGYCGDEDNGQTSAWYVFSALGFYPVCPVSGEYALGEPAFDDITVHLENGHDLKILRSENGDVEIGGKRMTEPFVKYSELVK